MTLCSGLFMSSRNFCTRAVVLVAVIVDGREGGRDVDEKKKEKRREKRKRSKQRRKRDRPKKKELKNTILSRSAESD